MHQLTLKFYAPSFWLKSFCLLSFRLCALLILSQMDSAKVFDAKLATLGLLDLKEKLKDIGATTMASYAFSANYVPGIVDDTSFINDIVIPVTEDANSKRKPMLKRLFFECYMYSSGEINKRAASSGEDPKPKKLPAPEREDRFNNLKLRLVGLQLRDELEPSTILIDKFVEIEELGELRYIKWEEFTRRNQEDLGIKKDPFFGEDENGVFRRFSHNREFFIDIGGADLLMIKGALQRRGLAMNVARLLTFEVHDLLVEFYFREMARPRLQDHSPVSIEQVKMADKEVFYRLGELTRGGFAILAVEAAENELPLDKLLKDVMKEQRVQALLNPYRIVGTKDHQNSQPSSSHAESKGDKRLINELNRLQKENKKLKGERTFTDYNQMGGKGNKGKNGGGKGGKGKGKKQPFNKSLPKQLIGMSPTVEGEAVCFDYNLPHGCKNAPRGSSSCPKGVHKCMFPTCGGDHGLQTCDKKNQSGNYSLGGY